MRPIRLLLPALLWAARLTAQVPTGPEPADTTAPADTSEAADTTSTSSEAEPKAPWKTSYFPYLASAPNDGPVVAFRVHHFQPAEYDARVTANAALTAEAGITFRGGRHIILRFRAPQLWKNWRLKTLAAAVREVRFGYFGVGNQTVKNDDLVTPTQPFLYRVRRARYGGQVEVTRRIRGPLQVALLGYVERTRFTSLPLPSIFKSDFGPELKETDVSGRVALVYDTRDKEYNTQQGLLLEAGTQAGTGGDGYTRLYTVLRGYVSPREGTVIAARFAASGIGGTPTLNARYIIPAWEDQIPVLGGQYSHRSFDTGRFAGKGVMLGNLEVRHDLLAFGDLGAITLIGFADAGRVFEGEKFTTKDLKVGGGGGIGLRILRSSIFTFNFAGGPDGFNFSVGSGWMF
ncbi:MAG TPA: BamA/TamA family outer membrane protein [Gemmatimonadales bacterium]|nr:BamA/TamA family outer membrane protein [Gemmatimonadales bacterium]